MTIAWVAVIACIALLAFLLLHRAPAGDPRALARLALLHGVQRIRGESEESLRNRTAGAARWPYSHPEPEFVWWARGWHRMTSALRRR
jgi:hypothetical protein